MKVRKPEQELWREHKDTLRERTSRRREEIDRAIAIARPFHEIYARNELWYLGRNDSRMDDADQLKIPHLDIISEIFAGPGEYRVIVNRLMAIIAGQIAELAYRNPYARVKSRLPIGGDGLDRMRVAEYLLNFITQAEENEIQDTLEDLLLNTFLGLGTLESVYDPEQKTYEEDDEPEVYGEVEFDEFGAFDVIGGSPRARDNGSLEGKIDGKIRLETTSLADLFQVRSRHWLDMLFDPEGGTSIRSHSWIADKVVYKVKEFKDDKMFKHKDEIELAAKHINDVLGPRLDQVSSVMQRRMFVKQQMRRGESVEHEDGLRLFGWRIFDLKEHRTEILIDDHPFLVYDQPTPGWVAKSKHPYSFLMFHRRPGEWYPLTEVENWIPTGEMYNQLLGLKLRHTKRFLRKYQTLKGSFDDDELQKLKSHEDGEVLQYDDPTGMIQPIEDAPLDPTIFADMNLVIRDGNEIMSSSSESRQDPKADTATQAAIMEGHSGLRRERKKSRLAKSVGRCYTKLLRAIQNNLPEGVEFMMEGPDGQSAIGHPTRASISGDLMVYVDVEEIGAPDIDKQLSRLNGAIALWGPLVWQIPEFVRMYTELLLIHNPAIADAIVKKFQQIQTEALILQQQGQGGYRGAGQAGQRMSSQAQQPAPTARRLEGGQGAGVGGGRQMGRLVRPGG